MANKIKIGAGIALDGEKEFRQAVSGINSDVKVLASEMKKVSVEFDGNKNSIDALTAKDEILNKQLEKQKEKVDALRLALQNSEKQYGENDTRTDKWKISLNNAEAELSKLDKELYSNGKYLEEAKASTDGIAKSLDSYGKEVKNAGDNTLKTGDVIKANLASTAIVTGVATLKAGVVGLAESTLGFAGDANKAFNSLASQTGASKKELSSMRDVMDEIYSDNFGSSIEDVADSMAIVKQQTNLAGKELKNTTEQALALRDTFDLDVNESVRSANMLMKQFGLTSEQSYNLIAQGAQKGLNKNGDLLDTINEYSVQFSQLGFNADEMFNMLSNGAKSGTFSIDKLGDSVKEFGIRAKDGSTTTIDGFKQLGLNANETMAKFSKGGDTAKQAFEEVNKKLLNMKDPLKQNQVGVELWGTMWEDLGVNGIKALTNLNGGLSSTNDALKNINAQKYNDIGSALNGLGREIQTSLAEPINKELTPAINSLISNINSNAPEIQAKVSAVTGAMVKGVGWFIDNSDLVISGLVGIGAAMITQSAIETIGATVKGYKEFKKVTEEATVAQGLFNAVSEANPIGLMATAIVGLGVALTVYAATQKDTDKELEKLTNHTEKAREENSKLTNEIKNSKQEYEENTSKIESNYGALQIMSDKLYSLAEKENKSNAEKTQMKALVDELNKSIPNLNLKIDEQTGTLNKQKSAIDSVISSLKEQAIIEASKDRYKDLASEYASAQENLAKRINDAKIAEEDYNKVKEKRSELEQKILNDTSGNSLVLQDMQQEYSVLNISVDDYSKVLEKAKDNQENAEKCVKSSKNAFDSYDGTIKTVIDTTDSYSKKTNDSSNVVQQNLSDLKQKYVDAKKTAVDSIQSQINIFDKFSTQTDVTKEKLMKNLKSQVKGLEDWASNLQSLSKKGINEGLLAELKKMGPSAASEIAALNKMSSKELKEYSDTWKNLGKATTKAAEATVSDTKSVYDKAYKDSQKSAVSAATKQMDSYNATVAKKQAELKDTYQNVFTGAIKAGSTSSIPQAKAAGEAVVDGVKVGVNNKKSTLNSVLSHMGVEMLDAFKSSLDIHSPSKKAEKQGGEEFANGIIKGVENKKSNAKKSASELGQILLDAAKTKLDNYKVYHNMDLADEVAYWNKIRLECKKGTQARIDADKEYYSVKKELASSLKALDKEYASNVKEVNADLKKSIDDVTKAYDDAVKSRASSILGGFSLFDEFTKKTDVTGTQLLDNLKGQVTGLKEWSATLNSLKARGLSDGLISELQDMGVKSTGELQALNSMTDEQLAQYSGLWKEQQNLANSRAESELVDLKSQTSKQITDLTAQANTDLIGYYETYKKAYEELGKTLTKPIDQLKTTVSEDGEVVVSKFSKSVKTTAKSSSTKSNVNEMNKVVNDTLKTTVKDATVSGSDIVKGMITGINSQKGMLVNAMKELTATNNGSEMKGMMQEISTSSNDIATTDNPLSHMFHADNSEIISRIDSMFNKMSETINNATTDTNIIIGDHEFKAISKGLAAFNRRTNMSM